MSLAPGYCPQCESQTTGIGYELCKVAHGCDLKDPQAVHELSSINTHIQDVINPGSPGSSTPNDKSVDADCNKFSIAKPICVFGKSLIKGGGAIQGYLGKVLTDPRLLLFVGGIVLLVVFILMRRR